MPPRPDAGSVEGGSVRQRPPRRMTPARRREHLISTALALYRQQAPEDISIDALVTAADVSRALFYRYFSNIRDLHVAALNTVVDELIERITPPDDGDLRAQLSWALAEFISFVAGYASGYRALLRTGSTMSGHAAPHIDRVRTYIVDLIAERAGIAEAAPSLRLTFRGWVAFVETTLLTWLHRQDPSRDQLEPWLIDEFFAMVTTTADHDPIAADQLRHVLAGTRWSTAG